jgi:hypothetical protein
MKGGGTKKAVASFTHVLLFPYGVEPHVPRRTREIQSLLQPVIGLEPNTQFFPNKSIEWDLFAEAAIASASVPHRAACLFPCQPGGESYVGVRLNLNRVNSIRHAKSGRRPFHRFKGWVSRLRHKVMRGGCVPHHPDEWIFSGVRSSPV